MLKRRVLVVDDEPLIRETVGYALGSQGYDVLQAGSAEEALPLLREYRPEVVVTDVVLGGMDGIGLLGTAKELDPETAVILITGFGDLSSAIQALRLGAEDYLTKPFDMDELLLRAARCLENRDLRRKLKLYERIVPVCLSCRKVRHDGPRPPGEGEWLTMEHFFLRAGGLECSHTYCPDCEERFLKTI